MTTIAVSQLPSLTLGGNTSNTIFVGTDLPSLTTGRYSANSIAANLYANSVIAVGRPFVSFPNSIAQFVYASNNYVQTNMINQFSLGTADYIITGDVGSDTTNFIDMGFAGSTFNPSTAFNSPGNSLFPLDGFLYVQGGPANTPGGNLVIGTAVVGTQIRLVAAGLSAANIVMTIAANGISAIGGSIANTSFSGNNITFSDGSSQSTAASPVAYSVSAYASSNNVGGYANAAFTKANSASNTATSAWTTANAAFVQANNAYNTANAALPNTTTTLAGTLTLTGSLIPQHDLVRNTRDAGNTTNVTIDFANDYFVHANSVTGVAVVPINLAQGKSIVFFFTNNAGTKQNVFPGVQANNTVSGAASFFQTGGTTSVTVYSCFSNTNNSIYAVSAFS